MSRSQGLAFRACLALCGLTSCTVGAVVATDPVADRDAGPEPFRCESAGDVICEGRLHRSCRLDGESLVEVTNECVDSEVCVDAVGCRLCRPGAFVCMGAQPAVCSADGTALTLSATCDGDAGDACVDGACQSLCAAAARDRGYAGCTFYPVDLDNGRDGPIDASIQQYAVVVSNPSALPATVVVERNGATFGAPPNPETVVTASIEPGSLHVFELPAREVDGSSAAGLHDGSHTALTANAYRLRSSVPVIAYQFNPLNNEGVFSNDASLLLPVTSLAERYTVVGWPQTLAASVAGSDQRATLTIVGTAVGTDVTVQLGASIGQLHPGAGFPASTAGAVLRATLGPFEVWNLETDAHLADFTDSVVEATAPVAVYSGAEATDVPAWSDPAQRLAAADHVEEQLLPDRAAGQLFYVGLTANRSRAVERARVDGEPLAVVSQSDWLVIVVVGDDAATLTTSLPPPDDRIEVAGRSHVTLRLDRNCVIRSDRPIALLQMMGGQRTTGVPSGLPGGDPASVIVPPVEQYRRDYAFLVPERFAFDFANIIAPASARVELDGRPIEEWGCERLAVDGVERRPDDPPPDSWLHRCALSSPFVRQEPVVRVEPGMQRDGVHRLRADQPIGLTLYGFDRFVSYAYPGGLDVTLLR